MDRHLCPEAASATAPGSEVESDFGSGPRHVPGGPAEEARRCSEFLSSSSASRSCVAVQGAPSSSESSVPVVGGSTASCECSFTTIHGGLTASCECPVCRRQCVLSLEKNDTSHIHMDTLFRDRCGLLASSSQLRESATTHADVVLNLRDVHVVAAFTRRSTERSSASYAALAIWEQEHERKAQDPEYLPRIASAVRVVDYQAEFLTQITPDLFKFYMCRQGTCLMVSRNTDWIQTISGGKYKCMFCGSLYRPFKNTRQTVASNMVIIFGQDSRRDGTSHEPGQVGDTDSLSRLEEFCYMIPLQWSSTVVVLLASRFIEVTFVLDMKMKSMQGDDRGQIGFVSQILRDNVKEVSFQDVRTDHDLREFLQYENQLKSDPLQRFDLDRCWKETVRGSRLNIETHQLNAPLGIDDLITLWWACKFYKMNVA